MRRRVLGLSRGRGARDRKVWMGSTRLRGMFGRDGGRGGRLMRLGGIGRTCE